MYCVGDIDGCMNVAIFLAIKSFVKVLYKENVCAKVFILYDAVKPCEFCATKQNT